MVLVGAGLQEVELRRGLLVAGFLMGWRPLSYIQHMLSAFHLVGDFLQGRCPWAAPDAAVAMAMSTSAIGPGQPHYAAL